MRRDLARLARTSGIAMVVALVFTLGAGCNFFGKQADPAAPPIGQLEGGVSFVGTWSATSVAVSASSSPSFAATSTYYFDPTGVARVVYQDLLSGGVTCTGYGVYKTAGSRDVLIYVQAATPSICQFAGQIHLANLDVSSSRIQFTDPQSGYRYTYFAGRPQETAPVGVWRFAGAGGSGGEGGIDTLTFDAQGYFILQTTSQGSQYQLMGKYTTNRGALELAYFSDMNPARVYGTMDFIQYITDGTLLQIVEDTGSAAVVYTGTKL